MTQKSSSVPKQLQLEVFFRLSHRLKQTTRMYTQLSDMCFVCLCFPLYNTTSNEGLKTSVDEHCDGSLCSQTYSRINNNVADQLNRFWDH